MRVELPIVGGYDKQNPLQASPADTINMYVGLGQGDKQIFQETPGLNLTDGIDFSTTGGVRKAFATPISDYMHVVVGSKIYRIDSALHYSFGYILTSGTGYVGVDELQNEVIFVDGSFGYIYTKSTSTYAQIVSGSFPTLPIDCVSFGNRFFVPKGNTNELYYSEQGDGFTWSTLNRIDITTVPDNITSLYVLNGRMYVFGKRSAEVWVLQGGNTPVARDESLTLEYGCVAPGAISSEGGIMAFIGYDKLGVTSIVATSGGMPERISTPEVEKEIQTYDDPEDVSSFMYLNNGNLFYQINFTTDDASWLYCFTTKTWSRLTYKDDERHRADCFVCFLGNNYVGDYNLPYLYAFSTDYLSDNDVAIRRKRITNAIYLNDGDPFTVRSLRFYIQQGTGQESGDDMDPVLMLRISHDNGATWGNQLMRPIGQLGQTNAHTIFYRIGFFKYGTITLEIEHYNKCKMAIMKCYAEVT
jgi:hypothetical protein